LSKLKRKETKHVEKTRDKTCIEKACQHDIHEKKKVETHGTGSEKKKKRILTV